MMRGSRCAGGATRGVFALVCIMAATRGLAAEESWTLRVDREGLRVETREVPGSKFRAFRASLRVAASPEAVLARLRDVARYPDWFPDTKEARVLEQTDGRWAAYIRTRAPWPVRDRDAVYVSTLEGTSEAYRINVSAASALVPEVEDAVRIREAVGYWRLARSGEGTTITWEFHVEPGGSLPGSLVNARLVATPRGALSALREYFGDGTAQD